MTAYIVLVVLATAAPGPKIAVPETPVGEADPIVLTLSSGSSVFIDGCAPLELERKEGEVWQVGATNVCPRAVMATRVEGVATLTAPATAAGEYRAAVGWGTGCVDGLPFHLAACKKFGVARSEPFIVGAPPLPVSPPTVAPEPPVP